MRSGFWRYRNLCPGMQPDGRCVACGLPYRESPTLITHHSGTSVWACGNGHFHTLPLSHTLQFHVEKRWKSSSQECVGSARVAIYSPHTSRSRIML